MTIKIAELTPDGLEHAKAQIYELCGRGWDSYEEVAEILETRAATGESIAYEIPPQYTLSKRPEFVRLTPAHFTLSEIKE